MRRRFVPGILVVLALAGCGESAPVVVASSPPPVLPPPPALCGKAVTVRAPKVGEDARIVVAREKAGRLKANRRGADCAAFYADIVSEFGAH